MKVYKFGGASINSIERLKSSAHIIKNSPGKILVVVSAMGKTTNALEKVAEAFFNNEQKKALELFEEIKTEHIELAKNILKQSFQTTLAELRDIFTEVEWLLHDTPVKSFDYYYDQIVACGELLSTIIFNKYLLEIGVNSKWTDIRDVIKTDNTFRSGNVMMEVVHQKIESVIIPIFEECNVLVTQGFIGSTDENESTTLGREGSDYSAAILGAGLKAESVTIWKDVDAVMNADPRIFSDAEIIPFLSYAEIIEMAYYGAQVIHPKTIKPLKNNNIPLFVKSFLDTSLPGTVINNDSQKKLPPIIIIKNNQALVSFKSSDYSFIEGSPYKKLIEILDFLNIKSNLSQHTAISYMISIDYSEEKLIILSEKISALFEMNVEKDLQLITIRHYTPDTIEKLTLNKKIILEQKTPQTVQFLVKTTIDNYRQ